VISISSTCLVLGTKVYVKPHIANALFGNNHSLGKFIFLFGFEFTAVLLVTLNNNVIINYPFDEVRFLKLLKEELKKEINRFENTNEEDFEIELAKEKKKYLENKVK